ncbi:MAG: ABC transporter ATP-binding protein [Micrococcales bacterium]|nr:ABC transporter ATP-binding protein [Micrococcales bacterium]MCL2666498.1 ABC transporter ATP-binding protein [Micrococcales bacterium]
MIVAEGLSKTYGQVRAVDGVSFTVQPGRVTGFLGPNGAGKSTTMRMVLGLDRPSAGRVTVNGCRYVQHRAPLTQVGALLEARAIHPGRRARAHLQTVAATHGIAMKRVEEVLELTGLESVARKRVKGFSLGMGQRLGIATALLGDPHTLILDEPVNGLDPEGVKWVRDLTRALAAQGRTVFLSSHLMAEVAQTADHVIVIGRGRILADTPIATLLAGPGTETSRLRAPRAAELASALRSHNIEVTQTDAEHLDVVASTQAVAEAALAAQIAVHELAPVKASLEDAYLALTADQVEFRSGTDIPEVRS